MSQARGIASERYIDEFIPLVGGQRVDNRLANQLEENADYIFDAHRTIVELKVLESEFGDSDGFKAKEVTIYKEMVQRFSFGALIRMDAPVQEFYSTNMAELYRAPLARIAKKANRQIRATKRTLELPDHRGVLWLVNDGFRSVSSGLVTNLMRRILNGANSEIRALVYCTNHYVDIPGNPYAVLLWTPYYADAETDDLPDFINWLGREWGDFTERQIGPFEYRESSNDYSRTAGARPIL